MLDLLDMAHPVVTLALVIVALVTLWTLTLLNQRLRVLQDRLDSLERGQRLFEDGMQALAVRPSAPAHEPLPVPGPAALDLEQTRPSH